MYDPDVGWRHRPNFQSEITWKHGKTVEQINERGWRDRIYDFKKKEGVYRIAIIGCSRTYGYAVNEEDSYPSQLEALLNVEREENVEVLNFGVNGLGLTQMYLVYDKFVRQYDPDLVILQFYTPTVYRTMFTKMWGTQKPAFILKNGTLILKNYPVPSDNFRPFETWLVKRSLLYKYIKEQLLRREEFRKIAYKKEMRDNKKAHQLSSEIIRSFHWKVQDDNADFVVFIWGDSDYKWHKKILENAGVNFFRLEDFEDRKKWEEKGDLSNPPPAGHWSVTGNAFVAHSISNYLKENQLLE